MKNRQRRKDPYELCACNGRLGSYLRVYAVFLGVWDILDMRIMYIMLNRIITTIGKSLGQILGRLTCHIQRVRNLKPRSIHATELNIREW